jgi:acetolactate synthase-1/2/3 large subunit
VNGACGLLHTLVGSGVEVCFANPGTSEMHFVAGLDDVAGMRAVLTLFEGVATGAADGYGRMTGTPAAVLLHLGPGLGNGLANLHNARRARTPVVAVVGDHARTHRRYDAPLDSDIEAVAATVSGWVRTTAMPETVAADAADAVAAARRPPGQVATLILPADVSWSEGAEVAPPAPIRPPSPVADDAVSAAAAALRSGEPTVVLIGGDAARAAGAAKVICETFPRRLERGGGLPAISPR